MMKNPLLFFLVFLPFISLAQDPGDTVDIPDANFKDALLHTSLYVGAEIIDTNGDGEIQYSEAEAVDTVAVGDAFVNNHIQDMTGIETFTNLKVLWCYNNDINSLDLSQNTSLEELYCSNNQLSDLDVTNNTDLKLLWCQENYMQELDLTQNLNLKELDAEDNQLNSLNLDANHNLNYINCSTNNIDSLDLQLNSDINRIFCDHNNLTYLNIRNANNSIITTMIAVNNPNLTCIYVDDKNYAGNAPNWHKDTTAHYVETEAECETFGVADFPFQNLEVYPNPVQDKLYVQFNSIQKSKFQIFNLQGKKLGSFKHLNQNSIDFSQYTAGIYFLRISSNQQSLTQKIIKL